MQQGKRSEESGEAAAAGGAGFLEDTSQDISADVVVPPLSVDGVGTALARLDADGLAYSRRFALQPLSAFLRAQRRRGDGAVLGTSFCPTFCPSEGGQQLGRGGRLVEAAVAEVEAAIFASCEGKGEGEEAGGPIGVYRLYSAGEFPHLDPEAFVTFMRLISRGRLLHSDRGVQGIDRWVYAVVSTWRGAWQRARAFLA